MYSSIYLQKRKPLPKCNIENHYLFGQINSLAVLVAYPCRKPGLNQTAGTHAQISHRNATSKESSKRSQQSSLLPGGGSSGAQFGERFAICKF